MEIVGVLNNEGEEKTQFLCGNNWKQSKKLLIVRTAVNCSTVNKYFVDDSDLPTMQEAIQEDPVVFELSALFKSRAKSDYKETFLTTLFTKLLSGGEHLLLFYSTSMINCFWPDDDGLLGVLEACGKFEGSVVVNLLTSEQSSVKIFEDAGALHGLFTIIKPKVAKHTEKGENVAIVLDIVISHTRLCFVLLPPALPHNDFLGRLTSLITHHLAKPTTSEFTRSFLPAVEKCTLFIYLKSKEDHLDGLELFISNMCTFAKAKDQNTPTVNGTPNILMPLNRSFEGCRVRRAATPPSRAQGASGLLSASGVRQEQIIYLRVKELERENLELRTAQERGINNFNEAEAALDAARKEMEALRSQLWVAEDQLRCSEKSREKILWRAHSLKKRCQNFKQTEQLVCEKNLHLEALHTQINLLKEELQKEKKFSSETQTQLQCVQLEFCEARTRLTWAQKESEELVACKESLRISEARLRALEHATKGEVTAEQKQLKDALHTAQEEMAKNVQEKQELSFKLEAAHLALEKAERKNATWIAKNAELKVLRHELKRKETELEQNASVLASASHRIAELESAIEGVGEEISLLHANQRVYADEMSQFTKALTIAQENLKTKLSLLKEKDGQIELLQTALTEAREATQKALLIREEALKAASAKMDTMIKEMVALGSERESLKAELRAEAALRVALEQKIIRGKEKRGELRKDLQHTVDQLANTRQDLFAASISMKCVEKDRQLNDESHTMTTKKMGMLSDLRALISTYKSVSRPSFSN